MIAFGGDFREQRDGLGVPKRPTRVRIEIRTTMLDLIELLDQRHHQRGPDVGGQRFDEAPPRMRPAANLSNPTRRVERVVAGVRVRLPIAHKR